MVLPTTTQPPILIIAETTHGQLGGTELNTLNFAKVLIKRGLQPLIVEVGKEVLCKYSGAGQLSFINIQANHFENVSYSQWCKLIKQTKPSVILRSKTWIGCINWKLDLATIGSGATYLSWEHHPSTENSLKSSVLFKSGNHLLKTKIKLKAWFRIQLHMKTVKRILAVSHAVSEPLIENQPELSRKLDIIYPGVDFNSFRRSNESRQRLRRCWNIPESAFVIGSLGRLVPHKRNDFTITIFAELLKTHPNVWCVIAGKGPDLERLQVISQQLGIQHRIVFPGWQQNASDAWSTIDLFLIPSIDEGLGMTLIESVASGCMILGAKAGGMKEILDGPLIHNRVPATDLNAWIQKASEIITASDINIQHQLAFNYLYQKFNADTQFNLMVDWLKKNSELN
jgi:glycosyltransferase involved in cell wall biosynthesis